MGLVRLNPDDPQRPPNSPRNVYQIESSTLALLQTFETAAWRSNLAGYLESPYTSDLVQDALHHTFERLGEFEPKQANALRSYLCRAVENRIRNELRRAARRRASIAPPSEVVRYADDAAPQPSAGSSMTRRGDAT